MLILWQDPAEEEAAEASQAVALAVAQEAADFQAEAASVAAHLAAVAHLEADRITDLHITTIIITITEAFGTDLITEVPIMATAEALAEL